MRKKIRTAEEDMYGVPELVLFSGVWYISLIRSILISGFQSSILIFFVAGILPAATAVRMIQRALYYRKFHAKCMQEGHPSQGRIVNIMREYYDTYDSHNRRRRTTYYFLSVEVISPDTGFPQIIKSAPYRIPLHKYLASPHVQVYTDQTGWKHVIDGFQLKAHRSDPDIPLEDSNVYLKDFGQQNGLFRWIFIIVLILMMLQIFGVLRY